MIEAYPTLWTGGWFVFRDVVACLALAYMASMLTFALYLIVREILKKWL